MPASHAKPSARRGCDSGVRVTQGTGELEVLERAKGKGCSWTGGDCEGCANRISPAGPCAAPPSRRVLRRSQTLAARFGEAVHDFWLCAERWNSVFRSASRGLHLRQYLSWSMAALHLPEHPAPARLPPDRDALACCPRLGRRWREGQSRGHLHSGRCPSGWWRLPVGSGARGPPPSEKKSREGARTPGLQEHRGCGPPAPVFQAGSSWLFSGSRCRLRVWRGDALPSWGWSRNVTWAAGEGHKLTESDRWKVALAQALESGCGNGRQRWVIPLGGYHRCRDWKACVCGQDTQT